MEVLRIMMKDVSVILSHSWSIFTGFMVMIFGYFLPIRDMINLLFLFFIVDMLVGYWAAHKVEKAKFSKKIVFATTIPRMVLTLVLMMGTFMWDNVFNQTAINSYRMVGWFIAGILLYSIAQNAYRITTWNIFKRIVNGIKGELHIKKMVSENNNIEKENQRIKKQQ